MRFATVTCFAALLLLAIALGSYFVRIARDPVNALSDEERRAIRILGTHGDVLYDTQAGALFGSVVRIVYKSTEAYRIDHELMSFQALERVELINYPVSSETFQALGALAQLKAIQIQGFRLSRDNCSMISLPPEFPLLSIQAVPEDAEYVLEYVMRHVRPKTVFVE
jgi:hypothetical protein